jgi:hypothetical protein
MIKARTDKKNGLRPLAFFLGISLIALPWPLGIPAQIARADEITDLQQEIVSIESRLKQLHQEEARLQAREKQLSDRIRRLKEESKKNPNLLLEIRTEASLRDFRDLLLSIKKIETQEDKAEEELAYKKSRLREALSHRIDEQIRMAQDLYHKGLEKEADEVYLKGLAMMDNYKKLSKVTVNEEIPFGFTEALELPPLSQAEPEQLAELADLLLADADLLAKEVARYTEIHKQLIEEKRLLDQIIEFQGVIERGQVSPDTKIREINQERQALDRKAQLIQRKISTYRERQRILTQQARQLRETAEEKKRSDIGTQ